MAKSHHLPQFSPPQFITQSSPGVYTSSVNITPVQANYQLYRKVNDLINKSTPLADAEAALNNAMETTTTFNNNT